MESRNNLKEAINHNNFVTIKDKKNSPNQVANKICIPIMIELINYY